MHNPELTRRDEDVYRRLRRRVRRWLDNRAGDESRWAEYLLFLPDLFHLMTRLALDRRVPVAERTKLGAAVAYFVSPLNIMPETLLGPIVLSGDLVLAAYVIGSVMDSAGEDVVRRHWAGDEDILRVIKAILARAEHWMSPPQWQRVRRILRARAKIT